MLGYTELKNSLMKNGQHLIKGGVNKTIIIKESGI